MKTILAFICAPTAMAYKNICDIEVTTVEKEAFGDDIEERDGYYHDLDEIFCPDYF